MFWPLYTTGPYRQTTVRQKYYSTSEQKADCLVTLLCWFLLLPVGCYGDALTIDVVVVENLGALQFPTVVKWPKVYLILIRRIGIEMDLGWCPNNWRRSNVCFIKIRTKHCSNTELSLVQIFMKQTLVVNLEALQFPTITNWLKVCLIWRNTYIAG